MTAGKSAWIEVLDDDWSGPLRGQAVSPFVSSLLEKARMGVHRLLAMIRLFLLRAGVLLVLLGLIPIVVLAAVTLVSFEAVAQEQTVYVTWETASEVDVFGFFIQRAAYTSPAQDDCHLISGLVRVSNLIPATGDIAGDSYEFTDAGVEAGEQYYYCLEAVENDGDWEFHGPISATVTVSFVPSAWIYLPLTLNGY